mgnify:CR=1 FL=1
MSKLCKCNVCCTTYFILYIPYSLSVSCKNKNNCSYIIPLLSNIIYLCTVTIYIFIIYIHHICTYLVYISYFYTLYTLYSSQFFQSGVCHIVYSINYIIPVACIAVHICHSAVCKLSAYSHYTNSRTYTF